MRAFWQLFALQVTMVATVSCVQPKIRTVQRVIPGAGAQDENTPETIPTPDATPESTPSVNLSGNKGSNCSFEPVTLNLVDWGNISLPQKGNVVTEAHYVVAGSEDFPENSWPAKGTEGIEKHLTRSCALLKTFLPKERLSENCDEIYQRSKSSLGAAVWTPAENGNAGQGSTKRPPKEQELWQGNMYWKSGTIPPLGTRFIFKNPANGRAVVIAMGYETGPKRDLNNFLAGITSEASWYLNSRDAIIEIGKAADQTLPFGPISCN